jgi:DNA-binding NarL/FixJ family response regulator
MTVASGPVLLVEDHELLAQSLGVALEAEGLDVVLAPLAEGADVLAVAAEHRPGVVLLDLDLGEGRASGEALVPGLTDLGARVVVVSGASDVLRLGTCLELGAVAVLSKSRPFEDVLAAVLAAQEGRPVMRDGDRQDLLAKLRQRRAEEKERRRRSSS